MLRRCLILLLALLFIPAAPALAQDTPLGGPGIEAAPTRGVFHPGSGVADGDGPTAVAINPAGLGELDGYAFTLRHTETVSDVRFAGRGTGIYGALGLPALRWAPWLGGIKLGGALEVLRPSGPLGMGTTGKLTLALGLAVTDRISLGISYAHLFVGASPHYGDLDTVDLGARLRIGRYLAAGLVLRDLNGPGASATMPPLERVYELETLLRPRGDDGLDLALGVRLGERHLDVEPRLRLWMRPRPGVGMGFDVGLLANAPGLPGALAWRVSAGLAMDFGRIGGSAFALIGEAGGAGAAQGASAEVHMTGARGPTVLPPSQQLAEVFPGRGSLDSFLRLLETLRRIERRPHVVGVLVNFDSSRSGLDSWAEADELRAQLLRLRAAGKRVYAYGREWSEKEYYVASAAERIYCHPQGELSQLGVHQRRFYHKELLERIGVRADYIYFGEYKSYHESLSRSGPSPEDQEQSDAYVGDLFEHLLAALQVGRKLSPERARALVDQGYHSPKDARSAGLIDQVATHEEMTKQLRAELGRRVRIGGQPLDDRLRRWDSPAIAVLPITGTLSTSAGNLFAAQIAEAAAERSVKAIVLRVDSGGGNATAGEKIAEAVRKARRAKPVICSFGNYAASAAYHLSAYCDRIYTSPLTRTGSIGTFRAIVDVSGLLEKLGIRLATWTRGRNAESSIGQNGLPPLIRDLVENLVGESVPHAYRPLRPEERAILNESLRRHYDFFLDQVAEGRRIPREKVAKVAQGRIWSGERAIKLRLCDEIGGLMDAVAEAQRRARIDDDELLELRYHSALPRSNSLLGTLLGKSAAGEADGDRRTSPGLLGILGGRDLAVFELMLTGEPLHVLMDAD